MRQYVRVSETPTGSTATATGLGRTGDAVIYATTNRMPAERSEYKARQQTNQGK